MRDLVRSSITGIAIAAASVLAITPAAPPTGLLPSVAVAEVRLAAAANPPPGALIERFLLNQLQNCSLICPFIVQGVVEVPLTFAVIPLTFARELRSGQSLLKAIALTDETVSGAANAALTGIIDRDLGLVLPRAQNALEVAVVGLIDVATTAVTQPADLLAALITARNDIFDALKEPPGTMPPPTVHNALEASVVRAIEIASALTFQAPERLLLGLTQAPNALFTTLGKTGNVGAALGAAGASISATIGDSVGFIRHAFTEPIPISTVTAKATTKPTRMTTTAPSATGAVTAVGGHSSGKKSRR